jgi:two-component system, OmpR family, sensor histidine kinase CiaH
LTLIGTALRRRRAAQDPVSGPAGARNHGAAHRRGLGQGNPGLFGTARRRLVAWNVSVLTLFLILIFGAVYADFHANIYRAVDQQLRNQQRNINIALAGLAWPPTVQMYTNPNFFGEVSRGVIANSKGTVQESTDCSLQVYYVACPRGGLEPTNEDALRAALKSSFDLRATYFRGQPQRVLTWTVLTTESSSSKFSVIGLVQISENATGEDQALHELSLLLVGGGVIGILLAALGSLFLAGRALVPIRQAFARQRQFTADASHELRTPLALIRANAEMMILRGDNLDDENAELVQEIIRETDHLNRMVGDLLTLARADSEMLELRTASMDFSALVEEVHDDLQRIAASRNIEGSVSLDGPVTVQGDEVRLRQLLLILLDNALKYTDPGGQVHVSLARVDGRARLVVQDTGIGIPPRDIQHIFERFYRVDRAREHESGGTGLGLAIARWIVQAHHGTIKVESELGKGTRFQVELPVI